jgi:hypothetical protein
MVETASNGGAFRWKRLIVRALFGGAACGFAAAVVLIAFFLYQERPQAWNADALRVVRSKAEPIDQLDDKFEVVGTGVFFTVDVENTTGRDVSLPQSLTVMGKTRGSHALHRSFLGLPRDYFIPARHVETITLDAARLCAVNYNSKSCFDSYFKDDEEIVEFDNLDRYELRIPVTGLTLSPDGSLKLSPPAR